MNAEHAEVLLRLLLLTGGCTIGFMICALCFVAANVSRWDDGFSNGRAAGFKVGWSARAGLEEPRDYSSVEAREMEEADSLLAAMRTAGL